MFWKRGRILNSLNYRVEKDLRETFYINESFKQNRWTFPERVITWAAKHLVTALTIITVIFLSLAIGVSNNYQSLKAFLPKTVNGLSEFTHYSQQIFSAQITILGLIFPLVIALIGILIQSKSSNRAIWHVYKNNSGFMLVGFSAIWLISVFVGMKFLSPWMQYEQVVSINISLVCWFLLNLALSGWFLYKTINFLTNSTRMKMVVDYAINEVFINDVRSRLRHHIFNNAATMGIIESGYRNLDISPLWFKSLPHKVTTYKSTPQSIKNVFFRPLNWALRIFAGRYERQLCQVNQVAKVTFPIDVNSSQVKTINLAETDLGRFDDLSSLLIRLSFRFSKRASTESLNMEQIVTAMFGQVEDALKENNAILFNSAIQDLESFQSEVESCMSFINDNGEPDNWMLLSENSFFGLDYLHVFIQQSTRISEIVSIRLAEDQTFFHAWCYFFPHIYSRSQKVRPEQIGIRYINGQYILWEKLMSRINAFGASDQLTRIEDSAIKRFISSWEHWHYIVDSKVESKTNEKLIFEHLSNTSRMIISALKFNNFNSCRWAVDALNNWSEMFARDDSYESYRWHTEAITASVVEEDSDTSLYRNIFGDSEPHIENVLAILFRNYWIDIRCLTAAYILNSTSSSGLSQDKINQLVSMLLRVDGVDESSGVLRSDGILNAPSELLGVFLRLSLPWTVGFNSWQERHLEKLSSIEKPEWISGRVYSLRGDKISAFLPVFFRVIGISLTHAAFKLNFQWASFLKSDALNQQQLEDVVRRLRDLTIIDEQTLEKVCLYTSIDIELAREQGQLFKNSIIQIIDELESIAKQNIQNAEIDFERLEWMGRVASESNFETDGNQIPQKLFKKIAFVGETDSEPFTINVSDYDKSRVVKNIEVNRAVNEASWLQNIVAQHVKLQVFKQVIGSFDWTETDAEDALSLMKVVIKDAEKLKQNGYTPILFVGNHKITRLIDYSRFGYLPQNERLSYDIVIESDQPPTYIAHVGGVEVHRLPINGVKFNLLVSKESFVNLKVKEYEEGRYVSCEFDQSQEDDLKGTLKIQFEIDSEFDFSSGFKYFINEKS